EGRGGREERPQLVHDADRGALLAMRRAPRPRVSGRAQAHGAALLHELGGPEARAEIAPHGVAAGWIFPSFSRRSRMELCVRMCLRAISGMVAPASNSATRARS